MAQFKNLRITSKFILWFLFVSLVPLSISIYVSYKSSRKAIREEIANSLFAVADNKANQIEAYLLEQKQNAITLSRISEIGSVLEKASDILARGVINSPEYNAVIGECRSIIEYYQRSFGYDDIFLVHREGDIIFSTEEAKIGKSLYEVALSSKSELADVFIKARKSQDAEVSDFEYYPLAKKAAVFIAAPVFRAANLLGLVVVKMSNRPLYRFVQDYTGLGRTGETILVSKKGDEVFFITPIRFNPEAEFQSKMKICPGTEDLDIQKVLRKEAGSDISIDYRGKEVLAVRRYLPAFRLGMIVKMDIAEVFASATKLRNTLIGISFVLVVAVVVMALGISYSISKPIIWLTEISKTISAGNLSARAVINSQDEIGQLAASFNQMTDSLVESKAKVEEQKRLLEEANKELDSFVYTVSHDLRAPLRGIDGLISFLEQDYLDKLDSQGKDYLGKVRTSARRMQALIDDLLKLSRISRIKNPYEDVQINELLTSVVARLEFDIKEHHTQVKIAQDLPTVRCDKIKIEEVFLNLVNNAIKFSAKKKDARPCVEIGYHDKDDAHEFYVKDNGIGIDQKYHQEIFGIFKRLHRQEEYEGTGAGLSIVKRIIDDHKGSIWVDSALGQGTTFYFTIPKGL